MPSFVDRLEESFNNIILENSQGLLLSCLKLYGHEIVITEAAWPQEWSDDIIHSRPFQIWLKTLGISGKAENPIAGGVGRAYPVGSKYIIKFTTDKKEAYAASVIKGHDSPHAANIYDVIRVRSFPNPMTRTGKTDLYAIAMERLSTGVGKRYRIAAQAVYDYIDKHNKFINDPDEVISYVLDTLPSQYIADEATQDAVEKIVHALYDIQAKTGVLLQDPHGGNVAFKDRKPGFYDFGRSMINWDHPQAANARIGSLT